jgi:hypothetical protein
MSRLKARLIAFYRYLDFRILQKKYVGSGIIVLSFFAALLVFDTKFIGILVSTLAFWDILLIPRFYSFCVFLALL